MTIHADHPFAPRAGEGDDTRRFRARTGAGVSVWTAGRGDGTFDRVGMTVSSLMTALGEPPHVLALLDPDADLTDALLTTRSAVVNLLAWRHRHLADVFADRAPAPGGRFTVETWQPSVWGPVLDGARAWAGVRLADEPRRIGHSLLIDTTIEHLHLGTDDQALLHVRGRYAPGPIPT